MRRDEQIIGAGKRHDGETKTWNALRNRDQALLFKRLATLKTDAPLFRDVNELEWRGPTDAFAEWASRIGDPRLMERAAALAPESGS